MASNKRDLTIGIDGDPKGFDSAVKSAEESAKAFDRELGKLERQQAMVEQRTKATAEAIKKYGSENGRAALQAKKLGDEAERAGQRAERAQQAAADAAEKLADGEGDAARAAELAAHAEDAVERAAIKAAEAHRAAAQAAEQQAQQERQLARDAELAATAERLGALKAAGATKDYNALLARTKQQHGDLSKTAVGGFKLMENEGNVAYKALSAGSEKLGEANKLGIVAVANGLVMLPALATVAAGVITLGLGGAIAAVGVMFAAKNAEIKAEYSALGHEIFAGLSADAEPFVGVLRHIGEVGSDEFRAWQPEIRDIFREMAPEVDHFVTDTIHSLDEFKPALKDVSKGFDAELAALGDRMGSISHNIATGIDAIGKAAQQNPKALADLITNLSLMVRYGGDAIAFLVRFKSEFDGFMNVFAGGGPMGLVRFIDGIVKLKNALGGGQSLFGQLSNSLQTATGHADAASSSMTSTGMATERLKTAQQLATMSTDQLKNALDRLTGVNQNAFDSETAYTQALVAAEAQGKKNNAGIHGQSAAATANRQALSALSVATKDYIEKGNLSAATIEKMRQRFVSAAVQMGVSRKEANALANQLLGVAHAANTIPGSKNTKINNNAKAAAQDLKDYKHWLDVLHDKTVHVRTVYTVSGTTFGAGNRKLGAAAKGGLIGYARGGPVGMADGGPSGMVRGPGTGTSDSIPTLLSNREFVVNAEDTAKNLPLLEAINAGRTVAAGMIAPRAVSAGGARGGDGASITVVPPDVHVIVDGHELFSVVKEKGREYTTRNHGRSPFETSVGR